MAKKRMKFKDDTNLKAAEQEAEERRLMRKKSFKRADGTVESKGVSFDETEEQTEEEMAQNEEEMVEAVSEVALDPTTMDPGILDSGHPKKTVAPEPTKKGKQRTIKIVSDGTYEGTSVYLGTSKLKNPDIAIKISREFGVKIVYVKEESLF